MPISGRVMILTATIPIPLPGAGKCMAAAVAAVVIVSVDVTAAPLGVIEAGTNAAVAPAGSPLAVNVTADAKPFEGVTLIV